MKAVVEENSFWQICLFWRSCWVRTNCMTYWHFPSKSVGLAMMIADW